MSSPSSCSSPSFVSFCPRWVIIAYYYSAPEGQCIILCVSYSEYSVTDQSWTSWWTVDSWVGGVPAAWRGWESNPWRLFGLNSEIETKSNRREWVYFVYFFFFCDLVQFKKKIRRLQEASSPTQGSFCVSNFLDAVWTLYFGITNKTHYIVFTTTTTPHPTIPNPT